MGEFDYLIPKGIEKKSVKLYGITGWFMNNEPNIPFAFGGYFKVGEDGLIVDGQLIDSFGDSQIGGLMNKDSLNFGKIYSGRLDVIHYSLINLGEDWRGNFESVATSGVVKSLITLLDNDAFPIACCSPRTSDEINRDHRFWIEYVQRLKKKNSILPNSKSDFNEKIEVGDFPF